MKELMVHFPAFLLMFVRISSFFIVAPVYSYKVIPTTYKAGLSFFLSIVAFTTLSPPTIAFDNAFLFYILKECAVGISFGLVAFILISTIQVAGGFIDFQMGFSIASVIDPQTGTQSPLTGQLYYALGMLLFLSVDGHHMLIEGILNSFTLIPLNGIVHFDNGNSVLFIVKIISMMFVIAFQLAVPLVICLFLVDLALGMLTRTVPQLNIFVVGLPVKVAVGFLITLISLPILFEVLLHLFQIVLEMLQALLKLLGGA